ncbi:MAG TPA: type IV secretory system conjugative DNA transfer family protein, partial [Bryobacteraceae bacterium]
KHEAERRGQLFQFFRTEKHEPTFRFNPFRGFDRGSRSVAQLCQLILDALNLNHGKGYGRSYYTERSRNVLSRTLKRNRNIQSFDELHAELRETVSRADVRTKGDAFELISVIEMLTEYRQLVTDPDETISNTDGIIFMPTVLSERQVAYFWLPAALESISVGEIAKLVLFNLRVAAQDWKRANPSQPRSVILVIDELQRVAGENLQGILQDARSFGIHAILANQSLTDLKSPTGFDLAPTIMTNTRVKFFFTSPSERECYVYVERGKGFTEARQFPQKGNPWLKELSPEEFAYNVQLAWPFEEDEYRSRDAKPLPLWEDVPGGNFYREEDEGASEDEEETLPPSDALPRDFKLIHDEEWERQVSAIQELFSDEDGDEPSIGPLFADGDDISLTPEEIKQLQQEILASISERGPDRSRCILNLLFENHLSGAIDAPTWKDLWRKCWDEPLDSKKGADVQRAANVRQAVYRLREIIDRFFEEVSGRKWRVRVTIQPEEYRLLFSSNLSEADHGSGPPMLLDEGEEDEEE